MICLYKPRSSRRDITNDVFQDPKTFAEHIKEYLEGNHTIQDSMQGSYDFPSEGDVDFKKPLADSNPDIYDVVSGQNKVFPEMVVTDDPASAPSVSPTPEAADVSNE